MLNESPISLLKKLFHHQYHAWRNLYFWSKLSYCTLCLQHRIYAVCFRFVGRKSILSACSRKIDFYTAIFYFDHIFWVKNWLLCLFEVQCVIIRRFLFVIIGYSKMHFSLLLKYLATSIILHLRYYIWNWLNKKWRNTVEHNST